MQTRFAFMPSATPAARAATDPRPAHVASSAKAGRGRSFDGAPAHDALLALDIETVPDADLTPGDWPADRFPKNAWHRIVAISFVTADILRGSNGWEGYALTACRSGGEEDWDEARLLAAFWRFFEAGRYRVVTWNGRAFDMPTILARSMMHGIEAPAWFRRGTKWEGYRHRFAPDWHTDLMDATSEYGAAQRMTLDEAAAAIGLPGKLGEHGSQVAAMVAAGEMGRVRAYCETDCVNLFALYLRWAHLTGRTDAAAHDRAILDLEDYLDRGREARPHLAFRGRLAAGRRRKGHHRAALAAGAPAAADGLKRTIPAEDLFPAKLAPRRLAWSVAAASRVAEPGRRSCSSPAGVAPRFGLSEPTNVRASRRHGWSAPGDPHRLSVRRRHPPRTTYPFGRCFRRRYAWPTSRWIKLSCARSWPA